MKENVTEINLAISNLPREQRDLISDKYHTFEELYEFRRSYNALLFNEWSKNGIYDVHKSLRHHDGESPFGKDNMFIVCAQTLFGQVSNHYDIKDWYKFKCPATDRAKYKYDGHTSQDVLVTLNKLLGNK